MVTIKQVFVGIALATLSNVPATAQSTDQASSAPQDSGRATQTRTTTRVSTFLAGPAGSPLTFRGLREASEQRQPGDRAFNADFELTAGDGNSAALLKLGLPIGAKQALTLKFESPVDKDDKTVALGKLASGATLALGYVYGTTERQKPGEWQWVLTGEVSGGYKDFEFRDAQLAEESVRKFGKGISGTLALARDSSENHEFGFFLSYALESGFEADADSAALVCESTAPPLLRCVDAFTSPPKRGTSRIVGLGFQDIYSRFGWQIKAARDTAKDITKVELPIFLAEKETDKPGKLTGGVKFAWDDRDKKGGLFVFIGTSLEQITKPQEN